MEREAEREYMRNSSIAVVIEQLKLRGENAVLGGRLARHDILIRDKDIRIKVKFSKPMRRSKYTDRKWEFAKLIHRSRLYPVDTIDFYILVGFGDNGDIRKIWKISVEDKIIYRKNQIFISVNGGSRYEEYKKYELNMIDSIDGFNWIG